LTPRETEVAEQLLEGTLQKQVAQALGISQWTVQHHLKMIRCKLAASSNLQVVLKLLHGESYH
jgi:DNA-binding CsgD family transcriptional regulator